MPKKFRDKSKHFQEKIQKNREEIRILLGQNQAEFKRILRINPKYKNLIFLTMWKALKNPVVLTPVDLCKLFSILRYRQNPRKIPKSKKAKSKKIYFFFKEKLTLSFLCERVQRRRRKSNWNTSKNQICFEREKPTWLICWHVRLQPSGTPTSRE